MLPKVFLSAFLGIFFGILLLCSYPMETRGLPAPSQNVSVSIENRFLFSTKERCQVDHKGECRTPQKATQ